MDDILPPFPDPGPGPAVEAIYVMAQNNDIYQFSGSSLTRVYNNPNGTHQLGAQEVFNWSSGEAFGTDSLTREDAIVYDGSTWSNINMPGTFGASGGGGPGVSNDGRIVFPSYDNGAKIIYLSSDYGATWSTASSPWNFANRAYQTRWDSTRDRFVTVAGTAIYYSDDDGDTWTQGDTIGSPTPTDFFRWQRIFIDTDGVYWIIGGNANLYKSTDGGDNVTLVAAYPGANCICRAPNGDMIWVSISGLVSTSKNDGASRTVFDIAKPAGAGITIGNTCIYDRDLGHFLVVGNYFSGGTNRLTVWRVTTTTSSILATVPGVSGTFEGIDSTQGHVPHHY